MAAGTPAASFAATTTDAEATAEALASLAVALDQLSLTPELGTPLPMTVQSPADLLGFPALFSTELATPLQAGIIDTPGDDDTTDLETVLRSSGVLGGAATVTESGGVITVTLDVDRTVTGVDVPVAYIREVDETDPDAEPPIAIVGSEAVGGSIQDVTAKLSGTITLTLDPDTFAADGATFDPLAAASIDPASALAVEVSSLTTNNLDFAASYGFTEVGVTGSGTVDLGVGVEFHDPDGLGGITRGEWENTLFDDLTTLTPGDGPNGSTDHVDVALDVEAVDFDGELIGAGGTFGADTDGSISYAGDLGTSGWADALAIALQDDLELFANVSVEDGLSALAQFATAVQGAQNRVDQKLPFVDAKFSRAGSPADDLMTLVERQGAAAVVCGRLNTVPPTGAFLTGDTWYCQAFTTQDPESGTVEWTAGGGDTITSAGTSDGTVGTAPTTNVVVSSTDEPDVSVTFDVGGETNEAGEAITVTADRRFRSVQDLHAALGATVDTAKVAYNATAQALEFRLDDTSESTTFTAPLDIGDMLRNETRLSGVEPAAGADEKVVDVTVGDVVLDAGFGLLMGDEGTIPDDDGDTTTETPRSARYLFLPGDGADNNASTDVPELTVGTLTAQLPTAVDLTARIGYLPTSITLAAGTGDLSITNPDTTTDALTVDVPATGVDLTSSEAGLIADVLNADASAGATATFNLRGDLSLGVNLDGLSVGGYANGDGQVDVDWVYDTAAGRQIDDLNVGYDAAGAFRNKLMPFDLAPTLMGVHRGAASPDGTGPTVLTDTAVDFSTAFGFDPGSDVLPYTLYNLTSGASCANVRVVASNSNALECVEVDGGGNVVAAQLYGSQRLESGADTPDDLTDDVPDNSWQPGDVWEIRGDPNLLRGVVLDALNNLANQLALADDSTHQSSLPLVGLPPRAFGPQFEQARDAIAEVASRPEVQVTKVAGTVAGVSGATVTVGAGDDLSGIEPSVRIRNTTPGKGWSCTATAVGTGTFDCVSSDGTWAVDDTWDATVSVNAADSAPADLAALETTVEAALDAQPSIEGANLAFAFRSLADPYVSGASNTRHLAVTLSLPGSGTLEAPLRLDFGDDPAVDLLRDPIDPAGDSVLEVDWSSTAHLDIALPWEASVPLEHISVLATSGLVDATATADSEADDNPIDLTGSFGSLRLVVGESATLEGVHANPIGTHDGALVVESATSDRIAGVRGNPTAGSGATQTVTDADRDFDELGVEAGDTLQNVTQGWDCEVTGVSANGKTLTCAMPDTDPATDAEAYDSWQSNDEYAIQAGHPTDRVIDLDGDFTATVADGDLLVETTDPAAESSCVLEAAGITAHTLTCGGLDITPDADTYEVRSRTVLEDSTRGGADGVGFDELLGLVDGADLPTGVTVTVRRDDGGTCEVTDASDVTATTLTCTTGLSGTGNGWSPGDAYTIELSGSGTADVVVDVGRDFHRMGIVGATLTRGTDPDTDPTCEITEARQHFLVCADGLDPDASFADGDAYLVPGAGIAKFELSDYDLVGSGTHGPLQDPDEDGAGEPYVDTFAGGLTGPTTDPVCQQGDDDATTWAGDACAVLSVAVPDDPATTDADEYRLLGIVKWESTISGETTGLTDPLLPDALTGAVEEEEPLQWSLLSVAFGQIKAMVRDALEDSLIYEEFPLIGADVSAGTYLEQAIDELEAAAAEAAPPAITATTSIPEVESAIHDWVVDLLNGPSDTGLSVTIDGTDVVVLDLLDKDPDGERTVLVTVQCKSLGESAERPCVTTGEVDDQDSGGDVARIQIELAIGDNLTTGTRPVVDGNGCSNCGADEFDLGFDLGLDGLPFDASSDFKLQSKAAWSLNLGVGLSRVEGPYLVVGDETDNPDLEVYADVAFPENNACPDLSGSPSDGINRPAFAVGFSDTRCARLNVGYFQGIVYDGDGTPNDGTEEDSDRTQLRLQFSADVAEDSSSDDGLLSISDALSGNAPAAALNATADANLDLYFVTGADLSGLIGEGVEGLPSVEGAVHATFGVNGGLHSVTGTSSGWSADLTYDRLILNLGTFVQNFLSPIASEINVYVKPLKPVIDFVRAPIPVLSDIAKAVGKPPVTVLNVIDAAGFDTTLVGRVLDAIVLASDLVDAAANGYIGLGGDEDTSWTPPSIPGLGVSVPDVDGFTGKFSVSPKQKRTGPCGKADDQGNKQPKDCKGTYNKRGTKQTTTVKQLSDCGPAGNKPCTGKEKTRTVTTTINKPRLTGMGLTFPILDDATQVFWMILGEAEPVLVRFDAGTLAASAGVSVSFGPFMAGPVPVDVTLGASFDFSARFAMGYDVRGIINLLKQDPDDFDPSALMDGLFIDDLDVNGNDVPEIVVSVTATVGAAVSIKIFKVGLEGGVTVAVEFNLKDPDLDGKLRLDEIRRVAAANPLCIFEVRGTLTFFVNVFVAVDLFVKTFRYTITLFKLKPPIELFKVECTTPPPALARPEDDGDGGDAPGPTDKDWNLRLLMGSQTHRDARWYATGETKEKFTIRQLTAEGAASGLADYRATPDDTSDDTTITGGTRVSVEAFGLYQEFLIPAGGTIIADAHSDHDTLRFESGTTEDGTEVPFTLDVDVDGGAGNDRISTGAGDDVVDGGTGNDTIASGAGNDIVTGGDGTDDIGGGFGDDTIDGGPGNDRLSGDAGADLVRGGSGDDDITGGPGLDPDATTGPGVAEPHLNDGDDVLVGDGDNDTLRGHFGDDVVFGDGIDGLSGPALSNNGYRQAFASLANRAWTSGGTSWSASAACTADAGSGADMLVGETGDDILVGGGGDDEASGGRGSDWLCGNGGDDLLDGDAPNLAADATDARADTIHGGGGQDRVYGREGNDVLHGDAGDDLVDGAAGHDQVSGGVGADAVVGGPGNDVVIGDAGTVTTGLDGSSTRGNAAVVTGTDGTTAADTTDLPIVCADRVSIRAKKVDVNADGTVDGSDDGRAGGFAIVNGYVDLDASGSIDADDIGLFGDLSVISGEVQAPDQYVFVATMSVLGSSDCVLGGDGHDALYGGEDHDVLQAAVGNDYLQGDGGNDLLRGAQQDDEARGGAGADVIYGDSGVDHLYGDGLGTGTSDGADEIHGGTDADYLEGNGDADELYGDDGADTIVGGSSDGGVPGGDGDAEPDGGDTIQGGPGADLMAGDNANAVPSGGPYTGFELLDLPDVDDPAPSTDYSGDDVVSGGSGNDRVYGQGGDDDIWGEGGVDSIDGNAGDDAIFGGSDGDLLVGGSSTDHGGTNGAVRRLDHLRDGDDDVRGEAGADVITGDNASIATDGSVTLFDVATVSTPADDDASGDDELSGGAGTDHLFGQGGNDVIEGGDAVDHAEGNAGDDEIHGGGANDVLVGGTSNQASLRKFDTAAGSDATTTFGVALDGDDEIHGNAGNDVILGDNVELTGTTPTVGFDTTVGPADGVDGHDELHGGDGDDRLWGQRGDDDVFGDAGHDVMLGDLATVEPSSGAATWPGGAPRYDVVLVTPDVGGEDELYGGHDDDRLYAGAAADLLEGGLGDDHLEGNGDEDVLYGHSADWGAGTAPLEDHEALVAGTGSDQDDLIGGSSSVHPTALTDGARDAGDHLVGDASQDVLIGDNGDIDRIVDGSEWAHDAITGGHRRDVTLFDRTRTDASDLPLDQVSGGDTLFGSDHNDRLYGQGGDDHLRGEDHEDQLQGNQGSDWLEGNDGDDDLIGGSDTQADGQAEGVGEFDAGDWLHGGAGNDVISGDNAQIVRAETTDPYLTTDGRFDEFAVDRWIELLDLDAPADTTRSGADAVVGGSGTDLVFGQDGDDRVFGASGDDYVEGNGGADVIVGDRLPDDVLATGTAVAGSKVITGAAGVLQVPTSLADLADHLATEFGIGASDAEQRDGDQAEGDGQDDLIGGSSIEDHRDGDDTVLGDGAQDFVLGDNAAVVRPLDEAGDEIFYAASGDPDRVVRVTERHDVGADEGVFGADLLLGGTGDDAIWGQDGDDAVWGEDGDDDLFGELGKDEVYGGNGEDALVGDRGGVVNTLLTDGNTGPEGEFASFTIETNSPPFLSYTSFLHAVDRRVDLQFEEVGSVGGPVEGARRPLISDGVTTGGNDLLRGGPDRDVLHGGFGDDLMNGDTGGDALFGYDGADVMWGGRGNPDGTVAQTDPTAEEVRGAQDSWVDHLFGGRGGTGSAGLIEDGADVLDYRPRTEADTDGLIGDPDEWHDAVDAYDDPEEQPVEALPQHHQGVDWMYGGWDRDVMQANLAEAGPNDGDRLIDWTGAYNLYTHCSQDYGGFNDQRTYSPTMDDFLHRLAWANGVGSSLGDVQASGSSAYNALAFVYRPDIRKNAGKAYPGTPGHGTTTACSDEAPAATSATGDGQ